MKKIVFLFPLLTILVLVGCQKNTSSVTTTPGSQKEDIVIVESYESYEAKEAGFTVDFPSAWNFKEKVFKSVVMFFSPQDPGDKFRENVGVSLDTLPQEVTLDSYYEKNLVNLQSALQDFEVLDKEMLEISGYEAMKVIFAGKQADLGIKIQQVFVLAGPKMFVITYTAPEDTFEDYLEYVEHMIESFQVNN